MTQDLRKTLVHLHIFKNAGSSLDKILKEAFNESFMAFDKDNPAAIINCDELNQILDRNPKVSCLTSHQLRLPAPVNYTSMIFPVFFIRHPIERIQSCFHFERDVQKRYPADMTLEQYTRAALRNPNVNAVINLQTATLGDNRLMKSRLRSSINQDVIDSAVSALNSSISSFGLVSHFDLSIKLIRHKLQGHFPELTTDVKSKKVHENFSRAPDMLSNDKLQYVKENLSAPTLVQLQEALAADLILYNEAVSIFERRMGKFSTNISTV